MKFTEEQVHDIMWEGGVWDEEGENQLFSTVHTDITYVDTEKSSSDIYHVIKELSTGKLYSATLGRSQWCDQGEYNAKQEWKEVTSKTKTITVYE